MKLADLNIKPDTDITREVLLAAYEEALRGVEQHRKNCDALIAYAKYLQTIGANYHHRWWGTSCGTTHCIGGWAATMPYFNEQGLTIEGSYLILNGRSIDGVKLDDLFGKNAYRHVFQPFDVDGVARKWTFDEAIEALGVHRAAL